MPSRPPSSVIPASTTRTATRSSRTVAVTSAPCRSARPSPGSRWMTTPTWRAPGTSPRTAGRDMVASRLPVAIGAPVTGRSPLGPGGVYGLLLLAGGVCQVVAVALQQPDLALIGFAVGALADIATTSERNELRGRLRRFGLGLLVRVLLRSVLLLSVLLPAGVPTPAIVAGVLATSLLVVSSRTMGYALQKVLALKPAMPANGLASDLPLVRLYARLPERRILLIGLSAATEVPIAVALWLGS